MYFFVGGFQIIRSVLDVLTKKNYCTLDYFLSASFFVLKTNCVISHAFFSGV